MTFSPLTIKRRYTISFEHTPEEVFAMLSPEGGNQWTAKTPHYLFGSNEDLPGAMFQIPDDKHGGKAWIVVAEYDSEVKLMRTVLFMPDVELLVEDFQCLPDPAGGTVGVVTWRASGITEEGNELVQRFFDEKWGSFKKNVARTLKRLLKKSG